MKKKFQLVLPLLALPLLTSCPPTPEPMPFTIRGLSSGYEFSLSDGVDLTIDFGLYCKDHDSVSYLDNHYLFFVSYGGYYATEWNVVYDIEDEPSECYWTAGKFGTYSKTAKVHIDSDVFVPEHKYFTVLLASVKGYEAEKETYTDKELSSKLYHDDVGYSIDENSNVTLSEYYEPYSYTNNESSLSVTSSEESVIEYSHESI